MKALFGESQLSSLLPNREFQATAAAADNDQELGLSIEKRLRFVFL